MRAVSITLLAALSVVAPAAAGGAGMAAEPVRRVSLPPTVAIDDSLRDRLEEAITVSPTLQRQLAVVAGAPAIVEVRASLARLPAFRRAEATIDRYQSGFIRARILLPPNADFVELLAHELEHVVEQIEGVDLAALERAGLASRDSGGVFETVRARDAGRAAAMEVEQADLTNP